MDNCKLIAIPMISSTHVGQDESDTPIDIIKYRDMIELLLYLADSRPDIMFSVCLSDCYQACPNEFHLSSVKRIMKYLKGTTIVGPWYPKGSIWDLVGYYDLDYTSCKTDIKSTSGTFHILDNVLVY